MVFAVLMMIALSFGNVAFDGPGGDEDFGLEQITGDAADRYKFRTSPIRNVGLQPTFMHNGAFVTLEGAIRHHLDVRASVESYTSEALDADLQVRLGPMEPVLSRLDPLVQTPTLLSHEEFQQLVGPKASRSQAWARAQWGRASCRRDRPFGMSRTQR